jgi:outer membrane protein
MKLRTVLIFAILSLVVTISQISNADENVKPFTLNDCISAAINNNLGLKNALASAERAEIENIISMAWFDPVLNANLSDSVTRRGGISFQSQVSGGSMSKYLAGDVSVTQNLLTGANWTLKFESGRSEAQSLLTEGNVTSYASQTNLTYTHPLLEGSDSRVNRSGLETAKLNSSRQWHERDNRERELVFQVKKTFYDALETLNAINVSELSLEEAKTLLESTKAKKAAGKLSSYEVMAAESGLASREEALLISNTSYLNTLDTLKNLMGLPLDYQLVIEGSLESEILEIPSREMVYNSAIEKRPDIMQIREAIELTKIDVKMTADRIKSSLAMVGQVGLEGEDLEWSGSIDAMNNLSWYLGLQYSIPLGGNRDAVGRYNQSLKQLESATLSLDESLNVLELETRQAIRNLSTAIERLKVTKKGVELQEQKLSMEKARFELGLITSGELLDFEEDLASARLSHIQAKTDYIKALAYIDYLTNSDLNK